MPEMNDVTRLALEILDVPTQVAMALARGYAYEAEVWQRLAVNPQAVLSGPVAVRRLCGESEMLPSWKFVLLGAKKGVPGFRDYLVSRRDLPEWTAVWLLETGVLNDEQQMRLMSWPHSEALWHWAQPRLGDAVKERAFRQFLEGGQKEWISVYSEARRRSTPVGRHLRAEGFTVRVRGTWSFRQHQESAPLAATGRRVLGDGSGTDSEAAWERFFFLTDSRVSTDLVSLMEGAALVSGVTR